MFGRDPYRVGIITKLEKTEGENGKGSQIITASGFEAKIIFSWRIILPQSASALYTLTDQAESVMKQLVQDQCGSTADADRQFSILDIATDQSRGDSYFLNVRYNATVADKLQEISLATGIGYYLYLDEANQSLVFECGTGVDRTATQSTNSKAIFTTDWDTIQSAKLSTSDDQYRNYAYAAGQGVGVDRNVREVYSTTAEPTDLDRKEIFIDARDADNDTDLDSRAAQRLGELNIQTTIDGMPLTYSSLVYRTDYDLGDTVTVSAYGESSDHQITEVKESWAPLKYDISCVFDKEPASLPAQVNTAVKSLQSAFTQTEGYIIESGSNSNGYYIKYSNKTMIQYGSITTSERTQTLSNFFGTSSGTIYYNGESDRVTFPVNFATTEYSFSLSGYNKTGTHVTSEWTVSGNVKIYAFSNISYSSGANLRWIAIGTWG